MNIKILGASALASLMAAGAAQAEMSVSGYLLGALLTVMVD